ncbi:unnamed protein product [Albugo candida]|uniref:leucine--tRNA ligase n=1 Tax=Albugo candida TaxID=65357 RepID=A0A024GVZ5_9STRA|nr:unnamed protein product [Albugo candida]|eukprot:CCI50754.1 unnamed protein product [Albugo candida]
MSIVGKLHIGHVRVYTISDCIARMKRMEGFEVLHPMGWDAFGLPAENAAMDREINPGMTLNPPKDSDGLYSCNKAVWTKENIKSLKKELKALGINFDWTREITTCDEEYYKWTQWLFLQLFEKGFAYRKWAAVNWDPIDKTVLANEQVDAEGRSWRSGAIVEKRLLQQWFLKITKYGDSLEKDLTKLNKWPEAVKRMQSSWIGRSHGSMILFEVVESPIACNPQHLTTFSTRVDTIFGATYIAVAPEIGESLIPLAPSDQQSKLYAYVSSTKSLSREDRSERNAPAGIATGIFARHPLTRKKIPIYIADYVLPEYGTGMVMGVPAHDIRDNSFAKFHNIPIIKVIQSADEETHKVITDYGILQDSIEFTGLSSHNAIDAINARLTELDKGGKYTQFRLRDWLVSRQRYWGTPIPIIHCEVCGPVGVPLKDLPVKLPKLTSKHDKVSRSEDTLSPLAWMDDWKQTSCPKCGGQAERDTDTLDTFVDSSWYYLRYCDAQNEKEAFNSDSVSMWMKKGVDLYIGGIEHAILHLLYSRFITKFLNAQGLISTDEPFAELLAQGMVLGRTYKSPKSLRYLKTSDYYLDHSTMTMLERQSKQPVIVGWEKMSKSKYNGVDPETIRKVYGADAIRLAVLFKAPPTQQLEWDEADLAGQTRWLGRIRSLIENLGTAPLQKVDANMSEIDEMKLFMHTSIKRVSESLSKQYAFNVGIAELMKLSNYLGEKQHLAHSKHYWRSLEVLVIMLGPLAPHSACEFFYLMQQKNIISSKLENKEDVHHCPWPKYDSAVLDLAKIKYMIQVNGRKRDEVIIHAEQQGNQEVVLQSAKQRKIIQKHLSGQRIDQIIFVSPKKQGYHGTINIIASKEQL